MHELYKQTSADRQTDNLLLQYLALK